MNATLEGKRIAIVGGTTGLGLSAAQALVTRGAWVAVSGRSPESLERALSLLGERALGVVGDAAVSGSSETLVAKLVETRGGLDGLYHVAGGSGRSWGDGPLHELTDEGWSRTLDLNLTSLMLSNRAAVKQFRSQGTGGALLNMGSVLGFSPSPEHFSAHAYAAAKSAVIGFSRSLAARYACDNIRVNVIAPALVETPMSQRARENDDIMRFIQAKQPLDGGRIGLPGDLDEAVCFLLGSGAAFVTGQVLAVDGGWCVSEGRDW
ncbi:MAG: SDR family NAD(P)-dependent oxidoreductase [Verrucomicrobiales bacterium]|nr:SDR family oxidoreductase [Verrucomicrobiae bacterium]